MSTKIPASLKYIGFSLFFLLFFLVYNMFSHGVTSVWMTWLWAMILVLGFFPAWIREVLHLPEPGNLAVMLYQWGLAAMTVSSLLRGIFEIAGTASQWQPLIGYIGIILYGLSYPVYVLNIAGRKRNTQKQTKSVKSA